MGDKAYYGLVLVAVLLGATFLTYVIYEEPQQVFPYTGGIIGGEVSYTIDGSDYWGNANRQWVTGPSVDTFNSDYRRYGYRHGYSDRYDDYDSRRGYFRKSNICREYYNDPYHPLDGECKDFYDQENEHRVKRCDTFCDRDFELDFDKCFDNYEEGTQAFRLCLDFYNEKESNYIARCVAECPEQEVY
tara:strand:+ start:1628 stop:2191 length:564 start_codon:yes stop_codon:yes gene_type:complete